METTEAKVSSHVVTALHWAEDEDEGMNPQEKNVGQVKGNVKEWVVDEEARNGNKGQCVSWIEGSQEAGGGGLDVQGRGEEEGGQSPGGRERGAFCPGPSTAAHTGRITHYFSVLVFSFF